MADELQLHMLYKLYVHVRNKEWSHVIARASKHPNEARFIDYIHGCSPLHEACRRDPPIKVVLTLLAAYPESAFIQSNDGETALHHACCKSSPEVVKILLAANIAAVTKRNNNNRTPLESLCWYWEHEIKTSLSTPVVDPNGGPRKILDRDKELSRIWRIVCILAKIASQGSVKDLLPQDKAVNGALKIWKKHFQFCKEHAPKENTFFNLHPLAGMECCPIEILQLAMKLCPGQIREADDDGNLPIHIFAAANILADNDTAIEKLYSRLDFLIAAYPCSVAVRNNQQRLPFHLAIESGKDMGEGLDTILYAHYDALMARDGKTGLYPFMLAACGNKTSLSCCYRVLRMCPELERFTN